MRLEVVYGRCVFTKLAIRNFKSFREETVQLSRSGLTVLVGPNGSGKSTVLEAAFEALALDAVKSNPTEDVASPSEDERLRRGSVDFSIEATVDVSEVHPGGRVEARAEYQKGRTATSAASLTVGATTKLILPHQGIVPSHVEIAGGQVSTDAVLGALPLPRYFSVDLRRLRTPLQPPRGPSSLTIDAEAIIQRVLEMRLGNDVHAVERLVADVQAIVPALRGVSLKRTFDEVEKYGLQFDMTTGPGIDASQVSEGTLLALALCVATRAGVPTLLLIDDIDRALHPVAQRQLVKQLRKTVESGLAQILCTTHSPYILGEFAYDEVRVLREVEGASRCMSLDEGPEATRWMKELDAGEYWSFVESKLFSKRTA